MKKIISFILVFSLFTSFSSLFAADTNHNPEPFGENEFSPWIKDLRRAEIITLGAMPFVTLNVTLGYWALNGFEGNLSPFAAESSTEQKYTNDQTIAILLTSFGICAGIGITDFLVHFLKSTNEQHNRKRQGNINIESVENDLNATRLPPPEKSNIGK